jgi:hypothetical protein
MHNLADSKMRAPRVTAVRSRASGQPWRFKAELDSRKYCMRETAGPDGDTILSLDMAMIWPMLEFTKTLRTRSMDELILRVSP